MKDYIFFDMDGVILDSMKYHAKAWIDACKEFGWEFQEKEVYLYEGAFDFEIVKELFLKKGYSVTEKEFLEACKLQLTIFKEKYAHLVEPFKEVPELLSMLLEKGKKLILVTSSTSDLLKIVLPDEIKSYFLAIIKGDDVRKRKPHPEPYLKALSISKASGKNAIVVENAPAGVISAKKAGLPCIGITTTLPPKYLSLADLVVKNHEHLKKVLLNESVK